MTPPRKHKNSSSPLFERSSVSSVTYLDTALILASPDSPPRRPIENVREKGILHPLIVRLLSGGNYAVIDGHARLASAQLYGLTKVPVCILESGASRGEEAELSLIANLSRSSNVLHETRKIAQMFESGYTLETLKERTGLGKAALGRRLKLLTLPAALLERAGVQIALGTLSTVANLSEPYRSEVCEQILQATVNPEVYFGARELREVRVARRKNLGAVLARLPRVPQGAGLEPRGSEASTHTTPAPPAEAPLTSPPAPALLPPTLQILITAFVRDALQAGHTPALALEALRERMETDTAAPVQSGVGTLSTLGTTDPNLLAAPNTQGRTRLGIRGRS